MHPTGSLPTMPGEYLPLIVLGSTVSPVVHLEVDPHYQDGVPPCVVPRLLKRRRFTSWPEGDTVVGYENSSDSL